MRIEIVSLRLIDRGGGVKGFADIMLDTTEGNIIVKDFIITQRNGRPTIEVPHTTYKRDGRIMFNPVITFPDELKTRIDTAILTAYFRETEKNNVNDGHR